MIVAKYFDFQVRGGKMKQTIKEFFTGKNRKINGLIAFVLVGMIVLGCNCNKEGGFSFGEPQLPSEIETRALVQKTLQDFATSVDAGDFTSFQATTSSDFQKQFNVPYLNSAFDVFIQKRTAVVPILRSTATMTPVYSPVPSIGKNNMRNVLNVNGSYATSPVPTNFELQYMQDGGQWKIIKIVVKLQ